MYSELSTNSERKKLILVVDDDHQLLHAMQDALESHDFTALIADNGKRALEILKQSSPDLFLLDIKMDPMNGFDLYQEIRKLPAFTKTPVFFLTGVDETLAKKYSKTLGVESYFQKPVELDDLIAQINRALSLP